MCYESSVNKRVSHVESTCIMKVMFWYKRELMGNKESTLPPLYYYYMATGLHRW